MAHLESKKIYEKVLSYNLVHLVKVSESSLATYWYTSCSFGDRNGTVLTMLRNCKGRVLPLDVVVVIVCRSLHCEVHWGINHAGIRGQQESCSCCCSCWIGMESSSSSWL